MMHSMRILPTSRSTQRGKMILLVAPGHSGKRACRHHRPSRPLRTWPLPLPLLLRPRSLLLLLLPPSKALLLHLRPSRAPTGSTG